MKNPLAIAAIVFFGCVFAAESKDATTPKRKRTPEELIERERTIAERRYGGMIRKEKSAYGKVLFLNAQQKVKLGEMKDAFDEIEASIHPIWELKEVGSVSLPNPLEDIKRHNGDIGVAIVEADGLPSLLVAPEEGWAIVNVKALAKGNPPQDKLAGRVRKEILRAFALAGGCAFMSRSQVVLRGDIRTPNDLDSIQEDSYGVEAIMALERTLPYHGVMPWRQVTYKKACQEGWAPAPTNEYQKAIWDKVRAIPKNPMKIEFDPKKGR